jgi:DNA-directed RNA polymerase specialized sigma24 family protein
VTDRLIRLTTALAVVAVASVAAIISYQHAYELVRTHGESGLTARLLPFTVDGLIWAASMVVLDASRRNQRVPRLALWSLGAGIVATVGANLAHGLGHGPIGALVSAWPALALVGSFELLMLLVRTASRTASAAFEDHLVATSAPEEPTIDEVVRAMYQEGASQRAIARELNIDRRKVKRAIGEARERGDTSVRRSPLGYSELHT